MPCSTNRPPRRQEKALFLAPRDRSPQFLSSVLEKTAKKYFWISETNLYDVQIYCNNKKTCFKIDNGYRASKEGGSEQQVFPPLASPAKRDIQIRLDRGILGPEIHELSSTFQYSKAGLPGSDDSMIELVYPGVPPCCNCLAASTNSTSVSTKLRDFLRYGRSSVRTSLSEKGRVRRNAVCAPNWPMRF